MGKIIVEVEMSLDGCIGGEDTAFWQHVFPFHSDDVTQYLDDVLLTSDALLMGEKTFEYFAGIWPHREGKQAEKINSMPKYVASRSLKEPLAWNGTLLKSDVVEEIKKLKDQPDKNLLQYGVGEFTHTMLQHDLVDEFKILVYPFTYGKGARIFDHTSVNTMKLLDTKTFSSGVVALHYESQKAA